MSNPGVAVVVLAAGGSRRYGGAKLALPIDGVPLVRRSALAALQVSRQVIVVSGAHAEAIGPQFSGLDVTVCLNADWALGMGGSIAHGVAHLRALQPDAGAVLIALADQYRIGATQLEALCAMHAAKPDQIIAAAYAGTLGAPCVFPRQHFDALTRLQGASGAHALLHAYAGSVYPLPMPEAAFDIDTPADYAAAAAAER